jgi:hypothetical protein
MDKETVTYMQWNITQPQKKEFSLFMETQMELENIMPSEKSQAHKYKCCTISLAAAKVKLTKIESNCSCQGLSVGEVGRCWSQRTNIQLRDQ